MSHLPPHASTEQNPEKAVIEALQALAKRIELLQASMDVLRVTLLGGELNGIQFGEGRLATIEREMREVRGRLESLERDRNEKAVEKRTVGRISHAAAAVVGGLLSAVVEWFARRH